MADNLFHPNCRKNGASLCEDALNFIRFVYQDTSFDGLISLGTKDSDGNYKDIGPVPCTQIAQFAEEMVILPDHDYYISSNIFANEIRSKDTLLAINSIVIDIDCHSEDYSSAELAQLINALVWRLQNDCFDCEDLPHPHYIVLTGRGVQLWWCVVPAYAKSFIANLFDVERYFASKINDLIAEFPSELLAFSVDSTASSNAAGLFRLPGTINTHCQREVEAIFFPSQRLNLKDFRDQFLPAASRFARMRNTSVYFRPYTQDTLKEVLLRRLDAIERLRSIRNASVGDEARNNFCLLYYATAKPVYGDTEAYQRTRDFNNEFRIPMTDKELKGCLCSARRKNYKYSTKAMLQKLDISDNEADMIGLRIPTTKPSSKEKKEDRNKQVIELFNQGFRQREIAEKFGIARSTVSAILKNNPEKISTLSDQIQELLQSGKTSAEVSQELHCSVRTVERHRLNPPTSSTSAYRKCDKNSKNTPIYGLSFRGEGGDPTPSGEGFSPSTTNGDWPAKQTAAKENKCPDSYGKIDLYEPFINGDLPFSDNDSLAHVAYAAPARIEAAILGTLMMAEKQDGDLYISHTDLRNQVNGFLQYHSAPERRWIPLTAQQIFDACHSLCQKELVVADQSASRGVCYFLKDNYTHEREAAELLTALITSQPQNCSASAVVYQAIQQYETEASLTLSCEQKGAIILALANPVSIVTGGPGTGKTATVAALCHVLQRVVPNACVRLCAPTGKAAVHLSAVTGVPAKTIHSLKSKKINCGLLVVDEASMVDIALLHDMLKMVSKGAHILFVGDSNQLPCIGGGNVLRDMLASQKIPVVNLHQIYRQSEQNGIVSYANTIWATQKGAKFPQSSSIEDDICFIRLRERSEIELKVVKIVESLKEIGNSNSDVQVLTPTREWARNLNLQLKDIFNPVSDGQTSELYSTGDRVICTENNYAWKLYNGQEGTVASVAAKTVTVHYDSQIIRYTKADMDHLELAYALTIYKAQGGEYPIVIIPLHESMGRALNWSMIYTAVTRAKEKCIIVGSEQALRMALDTTLSGTHQSLLAERLDRI